jgi:hypothetical protein
MLRYFSVWEDFNWDFTPVVSHEIIKKKYLHAYKGNSMYACAYLYSPFLSRTVIYIVYTMYLELYVLV